MTNEEKALLVRDLCARLPYNFVYCYCNAPMTDGRPIILTPVVISNLMNATDGLVIKPYLRPMSSMTEEEQSEFNAIPRTVTWEYADGLFTEIANDKQIDWLNENHFDYRGLIPMGLALEAPDGMYYKQNETDE